MSHDSLMRAFDRSLLNLGYGSQVQKIEKIETVNRAFFQRCAINIMRFNESETVYISAHDDQGKIIFRFDQTCFIFKYDEQGTEVRRSRSLFCNLIGFNLLYIDEIHHFVVYEREITDNESGDMAWYDDEETVTMYIVKDADLKLLMKQETEYIKEAMSAIVQQ